MPLEHILGKMIYQCILNANVTVLLNNEQLMQLWFSKNLYYTFYDNYIINIK